MLLKAIDPRDEGAPRKYPAADHEPAAVVAPAGRAVAGKALGRAEQGERRHRRPGRRNERGEDGAERGAAKGGRKRVTATSSGGRALETPSVV